MTLIEVLVAAVLLAVGATAVLMALGAQAKAEGRVRRREVLTSLIEAKVQELVATGQTTTDSDGDFSDQGFPNVTWKSTYGTTSTQDVNSVTVQVTDQGASRPDLSQTTLIYVAPASTTTGATG